MYSPLPAHVKGLAFMCCFLTTSKTSRMSLMGVSWPILASLAFFLLSFTPSLLLRVPNRSKTLQRFAYALYTFAVYGNAFLLIIPHEMSMAPSLSLVMAMHLLFRLLDRDPNAHTMLYQSQFQTIAHFVIFPILCAVSFMTTPVTHSTSPIYVASFILPEAIGLFSDCFFTVVKLCIEYMHNFESTVSG